MIFGIDVSSSFDSDKSKSDFLVLGKEPTEYINGSVSAGEGKFSMNFINSKTKVLIEFAFNGDSSYSVYSLTVKNL